jgi:hypothetical protein
MGAAAFGWSADTFAGSSIRGRAVLARNRLESFMILNSSLDTLRCSTM